MDNEPFGKEDQWGRRVRKRERRSMCVWTPAQLLCLIVSYLGLCARVCVSWEGEKLNVFRLSGELGCLIYTLGSTKYVRKWHDIIQIFIALRFLIFIISLIDLTHWLDSVKRQTLWNKTKMTSFKNILSKYMLTNEYTLKKKKKESDKSFFNLSE